MERTLLTRPASLIFLGMSKSPILYATHEMTTKHVFLGG